MLLRVGICSFYDIQTSKKNLHICVVQRIVGWSQWEGFPLHKSYQSIQYPQTKLSLASLTSISKVNNDVFCGTFFARESCLRGQTLKSYGFVNGQFLKDDSKNPNFS